MTPEGARQPKRRGGQPGDFVTQPTVGVGVDRVGADAQGGIAFVQALEREGVAL